MTAPHAATWHTHLTQPQPFAESCALWITQHGPLYVSLVEFLKRWDKSKIRKEYLKCPVFYWAPATKLTAMPLGNTVGAVGASGKELVKWLGLGQPKCKRGPSSPIQWTKPRVHGVESEERTTSWTSIPLCIIQSSFLVHIDVHMK